MSPPPRPSAPHRRRLALSDLARLSTVGLRTRKLRAGLSALGIAIGVAAIVAVLGLSASSQAGLLDEINQLGTNLLTVSNGQSLTGATAELPSTAPGMIGRIERCAAGAEHRGDQCCQRLPQPLHPRGRDQRPDRPGRIPRPPPGPRHHRRPRPLPQRCHRPRARRCSRSRQRPAARHRPHLPRGAHLAGRSMVLRGRHPQTGRCSPRPSTPPSWSATPRQRSTWASTGIPPPSTCGPQNDRVTVVDDLLAATANPEKRQRGQRQPTLRRPRCPSRRQERAQQPVPRSRRRRTPGRRGRGREHNDHQRPRAPIRDRSQKGARRDPWTNPRTVPFRGDPARPARRSGRGRARRHASTAIYAHTKHWATVIPTEAWLGGIAASLIIGAVAGLIPARRAARLSPTQALWSV